MPATLCIALLAVLTMAGGAPAAYFQNLVPNPGFETDADGNGSPDGWYLAGEDAHPDNWHCQRAEGTMTLSEDAHSGQAALSYRLQAPQTTGVAVAPDLWDFTAWREMREAPERHFFYSAPAVSGDFELEYPNVYRMRAWVKAENVCGLHIKLIGLSPEGNPLWIGRLNTPEGYDGKTGSWDWELWEGFAVANRGHGWSGRMEVWLRENLAEGRFWIDDVSVAKMQPEAVGAHSPLPDAGAQSVEWPSPTRRPAPGGRPRVREGDGRLTVSFANGTSVRFHTDNPGIGTVRVDRTALRDRLAPPIRPLIETESGGRYETCRFVGWDLVGDDAVVVRTDLIEKGTGVTDHLNWVIEPAELDVYERSYRGFRYSFEFMSGENRVVGIWDRSGWALGGDVEGAFVRAPGGQYGMPRANVISDAIAIEGRPVIPFLSTPCFEFAGRSGTGLMLSFFDDIAYIESWIEKQVGEEQIRHFAHHYFTSATSARTSARCIVFSPCGDRTPLGLEDEWTWARDAVRDRYRDQVGMTRPRLLPTARFVAPPLYVENDDTASFESVIPLLPRLKELGYEALMFNSIWESLDREGNPEPGRCSITGLEVVEAWGGEKSLKKLVEAAHAVDLKVISWAPTALNRRDSELLREHPEWICRLPDGEPNTYGSPGSYLPGHELTYVNLRSGYYDYSLRRYRHMRREVGLDGLWQDSFHALGQLHYESPTRFTSHLLAGIRRQVALQQMGYQILNTEGRGPFGTPSTSSASVGAMYSSGGRRDYRTSRYYYSALGPDTYYRSIANNATPMLPYRESDHPWWDHRAIPTNEALTEEIAQANQDYAAVRSRMVRRYLVPSAENPLREIGGLWHDDDGQEQVLFAYGRFEWDTRGFRRVQDVTAGKPAQVKNGILTTEPKHTYLLIG